MLDAEALLQQGFQKANLFAVSCREHGYHRVITTEHPQKLTCPVCGAARPGGRVRGRIFTKRELPVAELILRPLSKKTREYINDAQWLDADAD